jgi:hypothetical protein
MTLKKNKLVYPLFLSLLLIVMLNGCSENDKQSYVEETTPREKVQQNKDHYHTDNPVQKDVHQGVLSHKSVAIEKPPVNFIWELPKGWIRINSNSNFRIATFSIVDLKGVECSLYKFVGDAGGLERNISMWSKQINIKSNSEQLKEILSEVKPFSTISGIKGNLINFSNWVKNDLDANIVVSTLAIDDETIIVKLKGPKKLLSKSLTSFDYLIKSISKNQLK